MDLLSFFKGQSLSPGPTDDFWYSNPGVRTTAGVNVDESKAMTYSACWAATMLLSSSEGMLPLKLFRKMPGGGSEAATDHGVYRLINSRPNPEMTSMMFRSSRTAQQVNRGNCYSEIERNGAGQPINLWPIHASRIPPKTNIVRQNGKVVYLVNSNDGTSYPVAAENMLHVPSPISEDGIVGVGVIENARQGIGLGLATERQGASYFGSGANPKIVISGAGKFKSKEDQQEFRRQWNEQHGGPENANKPAILPDGMTVTALSFSAEDSQFLETRQFSIEEIARWYGVPPHLIGHLLRATYSNIEHLSLEFVKYSLMRWLVLWEQEINRKLLTEEEQKTMYARHVVDALERGDKPTRTAALQQEFFNGKLTINEWRALDDQNPIGPEGDVHFVQSAMIPIANAANPPQDATPAHSPALAALQQSTIDARSALEQWKSDQLAELESQRALLAEQRSANEQLCKMLQDGDGADELRAEFTTKLEAMAAEKVELQRAMLAMQQQSAATQKQLAMAVVRDVMARMLTAEISKIKHIAEKPSGFTGRMQEFYAKHAANMTRSLTEPIAVVLNGGNGNLPAAEVTRNVVTSHIAESVRQLDSLLDCQAEELSGKVDECVSKWHEERTNITI